MTASTSKVSPTWKINLLYDGDCPLCLWEVEALKRKDKGRELVKFTNIADEDYAAADNGGVDYATAMGRIHAVLADGTVINNLEVFRQVYQVLGVGWLYAPTGWPLLGPLVDWAYGLWAQWRLAITGRPSLDTLLAQRAARAAACGDRCRVD
jgi:predicted DCC family thiol-disulfide oxidoreductase YuxK